VLFWLNLFLKGWVAFTLTIHYSFYNIKMDNILIQSGIIAVLYLILKFGEMRFVLKEAKPIKLLMRDTVIVFISSIIGMYIIDQFMLQGGTSKHVPSAFMDNPTF
jgi:hypothetical protein